MHPLEPSRTSPVRLLVGAVAVIAVLGAAGAVLLAPHLLRNQLIAHEAYVDAAWQEVAVQLQRQHELIPKLVQVVKGYRDYEAGVIDRIITAEQRYRVADPRQQPQAARALDHALSVVLVSAQRFPDLAADGHFRDLSHELAGTKNRIAIARGRYNDSVAAFNARRRQFPWSIVAHEFKEREFYEAPRETQVEPELAL